MELQSVHILHKMPEKEFRAIVWQHRHVLLFLLSHAQYWYVYACAMIDMYVCLFHSVSKEM